MSLRQEGDQRVLRGNTALPRGHVDFLRLRDLAPAQRTSVDAGGARRARHHVSARQKHRIEPIVHANFTGQSLQHPAQFLGVLQTKRQRQNRP